MGRSIRNTRASETGSSNAASISVAAGSNVTVTENNGVYTVNSTATGSGLTSWSETNNHIIPNTNAQYDIGSAEKKVRHLFLSQNSLYMGPGDSETDEGTPISLDADGDLKVGTSKLIKGDTDGNLPIDKLPDGVQTVTPQHTDNVLSGLMIGSQTYTLPSGGGGGGTTVTAHTDTSTGNEDYLSALTVGDTKYKIGTTIQGNFYSDSSKLHLSFPFQKASSSADALVNQVSGPNATTYNTEFTSGTGFIYQSPANSTGDRTTVDIDTSITLPLTIFIRFYRTNTGDNR